MAAIDIRVQQGGQRGAEERTWNQRGDDASWWGVGSSVPAAGDPARRRPITPTTPPIPYTPPPEKPWIYHGAAESKSGTLVKVLVGHTAPAHFRQQACLLLSPLSGTSFLLSLFSSSSSSGKQLKAKGAQPPPPTRGGVASCTSRGFSSEWFDFQLLVGVFHQFNKVSAEPQILQ